METVNRDELERVANLIERRIIYPNLANKEDALDLILILQHLKMNVYEALKEGDIDKAKKAYLRYNKFGWKMTSSIANTAVSKGYLKEVDTFVYTANVVGFKELVILPDTKVDWVEDWDSILNSTITIRGHRYLERASAPFLNKAYNYFDSNKPKEYFLREEGRIYTPSKIDWEKANLRWTVFEIKPKTKLIDFFKI